MITTTLSIPDLADPNFGRAWRAFAAESGAGFFQDWTWVGCIASERYPDPVLAETTSGGRLVARALFNRRRDRPWGETLYLHESGAPALDAVFIEHNGPLVMAADPDTRRAILASLISEARSGALTPARQRRLVLSGVDDGVERALDAAGDALLRLAVRSAPLVDFSAIAAADPYLDTLSRNTRHQLRRSNRAYAAVGELTMRRAETVATGLADLAELVRLHEITWHSRGEAGAFGSPEVRRFHGSLLAEGIPRGEVDLLKIAAGDHVIGYLMNFRHRDAVCAYQSGFNYAVAATHMKPGLTCHSLAIEAARRSGAASYDFLAGPDRYKTSLANAERRMHWLSLAAPTHPAAIVSRLKKWRRGVRGA